MFGSEDRAIANQHIMETLTNHIFRPEELNKREPRGYVGIPEIRGGLESA